jgi:CBS domain containing-hemolysin-like protein
VEQAADHAAELSTGGVLFRLGIALVLVLANGFFVAAEFALVGARRTRIEALARAGNRKAKRAYSAITHLDHYISGTQLGITLASLGLGWVGESALSVIFLRIFGALPAPLDVIASHAVAATFAFALITFMHIVLGELAPKSLALLFPERVSLWTAGPLIFFSRALTPFIVFLNGTANLLLKTVGLRAAQEMERVHRPEEIEMLVTQSYEHGLIKQEPVGMIRGVFHLSETSAAEVMTPRTAMIALPVEMSVEDAVDYILEQEHSRYAVYEESVDHIVGVALSRDVWRAQRQGETDLRKVMREPLFIPDTKSVESLLRLMQQQGEHLAVVVDEFGGTAGIVTIEDVLEEIVGEIEDEADIESSDIVISEDGRIQLRGSVAITEVNERFGLDFPDQDYTTIGGFVLGRLGRLARAGDEVKARGATLKVAAMHRRRIDKLVMRLPAKRERPRPDDMDAPPE